MRTRVQICFTLLLLMSALLTLTTCKKETDNEEEIPPPSLQAVPEKTSVYPLEFCKIYVKGAQLTLGTFTATILSEVISLEKLNDTTLIFIMPDITAGSVNLDLTISNESKRLNYTLLQHSEIADPKAYSLTYIDNFETAMNILKTEMIKDSMPITNISEVVAYYTQKFRQQINGMSEDELKTLALAIQSNNLNDFGDSITPKSKFNFIPEKWLKERREILSYDKFSVVYEDAVISIYMQSNNPLDWVIALLHVPHWLWYYGWCWIDIVFLEGSKYTSIQIGPLFPELERSSITFENNIPQALSFKSKYRNINKNDLNSQSSFILGIIEDGSEFVSKVIKANSEYLKEKQVTVPKKFSETEEFVSGDLIKVHSQYLNVSNISNQNVSLSAFTKSEFIVTLTFVTTQTTEQAFKFDLAYNNPGVNSNNTTFDGVLTGAEPFSIAKDSGDNQTGQLGQPLPHPITVIVKDQEGNPFNGAIVKFEANNNGSVSQPEVTTESDGIASVNWTLGTVEESQTMTVTAFKTDNITPLQGSPLTFSSSVGFHIGQIYGGGVIFYIDSTGQHGLIAAPIDQDTAKWGCYGTLIGGTLSTIGSGQANTTAIVNGCSTPHIAASICNDLVLNGHSDWFLPSKDELTLMYPLENVIGGFNHSFYWSSSEADQYMAWQMFKSTGIGWNIIKNATVQELGVRAVRAF